MHSRIPRVIPYHGQPRLVAGLLILLPLLAVASNCGVVSGQESSPRPAAEIVRDFHRVAMPSFSDGNTPEAIERFQRQIDEGCRAQGRFAQELLASYPRHPELPELLRTRWAGMNNALGESGAVLAEGQSLVAGTPTAAVAKVAWTAMARAALFAPGLALADRREIVLRAAREAPGDEDAGYQLLDFVRLHSTEPAEARELIIRIEKEYAASQWTAPEAKKWRTHLGRIGTAHREQFEDFRSNTPFDSDRAKGPRIVHYFSPYSEGIDLELAAIASLLERHREAGLAVVGVHDGKPSDGAEKLAAWLEERRVTWPQRLALPAAGAKPWETGISLPQVPFALLIDREGKIRMISSRIAALEPMLEMLLAETPRRGEAL